MSGVAKESFVQLPADGVGKQVRNLAMNVVQPDGTVATVYVQVLGPITDSDGRVVDISGDTTNRLLARILNELQVTRRLTANSMQVWSAGDDDIAVPDNT
jgi:hypothetical protein